MTLQSYISDKKYICWYVSDIEKLSDDAIIEWIIKYGTWEDLKYVISTKKDIFKNYIKNLWDKKRINLSKKELNFITKLNENV